MHFTEEQKRQLRILDEYLRYVDLDELQRQTSEAMTVLALRGDAPPFPSVIDAIVTRIEYLETENMNYNQRLTDTNNDIQMLSRILRNQQKANEENSSDLNSLCSRHGIW